MTTNWWARTPLRERRIILDESDIWDGNTYAMRTWEELPAHIQIALTTTKNDRVRRGVMLEPRELCTCGIGDDLQSISRHAMNCPMRIDQ